MSKIVQLSYLSKLVSRLTGTIERTRKRVQGFWPFSSLFSTYLDTESKFEPPDRFELSLPRLQDESFTN